MDQLVKRQRSRSDRGSISGFVVVITMTVLVCAGLAVDGARIVGGKVSAADHAANAARAGAQELTSLHNGAPVIDPARARRTAQSYLATHGLSGSVSATPQRVTVTVRITVNMTLLRLAGVPSKSVTATRSSAPIS
ncbi:MAG: hypothetical protein JWN39_2509 [Ilumatobacteraceae bacterium]|nr:hypothetical protein [Ilumatobacteraceae bacterium]